MFLENYKRFIKYYGKGKKLQLVGFIFLSLIAGMFELAGVALIYPFIMLIVSPQIIINTSYYLKIQSILHTNSSIVTALCLGAFILGVFIVKNIFMLLIIYLQTKFTTFWKSDISRFFMRFYMFNSYKNAMKISESDKIFYLTSLSSQVIDGFVVRLINLGINVVIISMIISFLIFKFPIAAIVTIAFTALSMVMQNKFFKQKINKLAMQMYDDQKVFNNSVIQNIYSLKEVKVLSAEQYFYDKYIMADNAVRKAQLAQIFYSSIPPYIVETFIVISLLLLGALISVQTPQNGSILIASFAVIVASLFRIAPALNRIQTSIININSTRDFVKRIIDIYEKNNMETFNNIQKSANTKIEFRHEIKLEDINFSYDEKPVLKHINFSIKKGDFIGIIGLSGAGKTTLADILLGLLPPDSGNIYVDNIKLTKNNYGAFRDLTGYVMQEIRLLDGSFRENIAWGVDKDKIDDNKVCQALKSAKLYDFVMGFEHGIYENPFVGTVGLSQGQKQRLAIARALYRNPEILILDEATSALDAVVENEITEILNKMSEDRTIIAIAHRLSTLKACTKLVYLKEGQIVDIGTFEELSAHYADFAQLVKLSTISEKK